MKRTATVFTVILLISMISGVFAQSYREVHGPTRLFDTGAWVEARVDTNIGFFGIGKYNPSTELTWDFIPVTSGTGNSNFIVRIDGTSTYGLYYVGSELTFNPPLTSVLEPFHSDGFPRIIGGINTIHDKWVIDFFGDNIVVNQYFQPDSVDTLGVIKIRYVIQNNGSVAHSVALEHKYDVNINGVDNAPIAVPGIYAAENTVFDTDLGDGMPVKFLAAEEGFDDSTYGLVARGILKQYEATEPDFLAYGEEEDLIFSNFSITTAFAGGSYSLSGALLRWNDVLINPGDSWEITTYYGLGDAYFQSGQLTFFGLTFDNWGIDNCSYVNPHEFNLYLQNASEDTSVFDTVWVSMSYDSDLADLHPLTPYFPYTDTIFYDLETFEPEPLSWAFNALGDTCGEFCVRLRAHTNVIGVDPIDTIFCREIKCFSGIEPTAFLDYPENLFTACTTGMGLYLTLIMDDSPHADEGVKYQNTVTRIRMGSDSLIFNVDNIDEVSWTPASNAMIETLTVNLDDFDTLSFGDGDTLEVCVLRLEDIHGCSLEVPLCWDILVDTEPPYIDSLYPPPDTIISNPIPTISFHLYDSISGVDTSSVSFQINSDPILTISPGEAVWNSIINEVSYDYLTGFDSETWVTVCVLGATDFTDGICGPNEMADTCWEFFVDYTPPGISIIQPVDGDIISCDSLTEETPLIIIADDSTCLDSTMGIVTFTPGPTINLATWPYVNWSCNQLEVYGVALTPGIVDVSVDSLTDQVGNSASTEFISFTVDTIGPQPNPFSITPPDSSVISSFFTCDITVVEESDIDETTLEWHFFINHMLPPEIRAFPSTHISYVALAGSQYEISYTNIGPDPIGLSDGDTLTVCLVGCSDIATLCGANPLDGDSICWTYFVDGAGPTAELLWPIDGVCTACNPADGDGEIQVRLSDIAGIDSTSVQFRVDDTPFPAYEIPDGDTTVDVYDIIVTHGYDIPICPDSVEVQLLQAYDNLGNSADTTSWFFKIDTMPPFTDPETWEPYIGHAIECTTTSPYDTIVFCVDPGCCGGFFHDSVKVIIRNSSEGFETIWGYEHPEWWIGDCFRIPIPDITAGDGDSLFINLAYARDSLDFMIDCGSNVAENQMSLDPHTYDWGILISAGGPVISRLQPQKRYVSCDNFQYIWRVNDNDGLNDTSMVISVWSASTGPDIYTWGAPEIGISCDSTMETCRMTFDLDLSTYAAPGESVCVEVQEFYDAIDVVNEAPSTWCVRYDNTDPCPIDHWPTEGLGLSVRTPTIWAFIDIDIAPVLAESLGFSFDGGMSYIYQGMFPGAIYWIGDTGFCDISMLPDTLWPRGGDTIDICIRNTDNTDTLVDCPLNQCDSCWSFWIEANGPVPTAIEPGEDWIVTCPTIDSLVIALEDSDDIIWDSAWATCTTRVNGDIWNWDPTSPGFSGAGHTLKLFPSPVMAEEDTYDVWIYAVDELINPLISPDGIYHYTFIIDHSPPDSIWLTPPCHGDSVDSPVPTIWLHAHDEWGRVDSLSWCLEFWNYGLGDWIEVCCDSIPPTAWELYPDSVGLHTGMLDTLAPWWSGGDTIYVHVSRVCDYSDMCPPNCTMLMDTCEMLVPSQGPHVENIWPDYNGVLGCEQPDTFVFTLYDGEGVDTSTVRVKYWDCTTDTSDTAVFTLDSPEVVYYIVGDTHDTLGFVPPHTVPEGCTLWIEIEARDIFDNEQVEGAFPFIYDYTPPGFEIAYSPIDAVYSFSPRIPMRFPDDIAGVDSTSVIVSLHSWCGEDIDTLRAQAGDTLYWILDSLGNPDTLIFSFLPLERCMSTDSSACLTVHIACDNNAACEVCTLLDTTWCFTVMQGGPQVDFYHPPSTGPLLCPEDSVVMDLIDPDGINTDSIHVSVNSVVYPYPTPGRLFWDAAGTRLAFYPSAPFDTDEVTVCIWGGTDLLDYEMDSICIVYDVDLHPPMPTYIGPASPVSDPQPDIIFYVEDEFNLITPECFQLFVDGTSYSFDDLILTWTTDLGTATAGTLSWHADAAAETLLVGDTIWVCMEEACDSTGCSDNNYLSDIIDTIDTYCWWFLMEPGVGPIVTLERPPACSLAINCATGFQFIWYVDDDEGLADYSLDISMFDGVAVQHYDMDSPEVDIIGRSDSTTDSLIILNVPPIITPGWIWVTIDSLDDLLGNPAVGISDTCWFLIDWDKPYTTDHWPSSGEEIATPYPMCWWEIQDTSWKVDTTTGQIVVDGTRYGVSDPQVWWTGDEEIDTIWFQPLPGEGFDGGATVTFCVDSVADSTILCEPSWLSMVCDSFFINGEGPMVSLIFPDFDLDTMVTFCDSGAFYVMNVDPERLDSFEIEVVWNGTDTISWTEIDTMTGDTTSTGYFELTPGTGDTDYVAIWPPFSLSNGDTICLTIPASMWPDTLGNGLIADKHWCAVVDLQAPILDITGYFPLDGSITDTWRPTIFAHFEDSIAFVGHGCVEFYIEEDSVPWNGGTFPADDPQVSWSLTGDTVFFTPDTDFTEFSEICVQITICDSTTISEPYNCPPNVATYDWCFTIGDDDTLGPQVVWFDTCYSFEGNDTFTIMVGLADEDGIFDDASTDTTGQGLMGHFTFHRAGGTTDYWIPLDISDVQDTIDVPGDTIYWAMTEAGIIPPDSLGAWDSLCYEIWAYDNDFDFDNPIDRHRLISETHCCVIYDTLPPVIVAFETPEGTYTSCRGLEQAIIAGFVDYNDVIPESLYIVYFVDTFMIDTSVIEFIPGYTDSIWNEIYPEDSAAGTIIYAPRLDTGAWDDGDTIHLCVGGVYDIWFNNAEDSCWFYYADFMPPEAECVDLADTNQEIEDFTTVEFEIHDNLAGVDIYSLILTIESINDDGTSDVAEVAFGDLSMNWDSLTGILTFDIAYLSGFSMERGDSLFFSMYVNDLTMICDPNVFDDYLCMKYIKPITRCHASPQPFTPPPPADGYNDLVFFDYPGRIDFDATIKIYDMRGRLMVELEAGPGHVYKWDGYDWNGVASRPGVYTYVVEEGGEVICSGTVVLAR